MRIAENWKDYRILDTTEGDKLESWGGKVLVRPDPQIIWKSPKRSDMWEKADGIYHRSSKGGGEWEYRRKLPESWKINYGDICHKTHRFQAHGAVPRTGCKLGLYGRYDKECRQTDKGAEPVCLHRRRDPCLRKCRCERFTC